MAGIERDLFEQKKEGRIEKAAWWIAEKSMFITVPLAVFAVVTGTAVAAGVASLAIDGGEYLVIRAHKNKEKGVKQLREQGIFQADKPSNVIYLDSLRKSKNKIQRAA